MAFEWDPRKNAANVAKHGLSFADASRIFEAPIWTYIDHRIEYGEIREVSVGCVEGAVFITVTHTARHGRTRIISARPASQRERKRYEQEIRSADDPG